MHRVGVIRTEIVKAIAPVQLRLLIERESGLKRTQFVPFLTFQRISTCKMHKNCQRKFLPILNKAFHWYQGSHECKYCTLSVAATRPRSIEMKEVEDVSCSSFSNDKESALDTFTDRLVQQKSKKWELLNTKLKKTAPSENSCQQEENQIKKGNTSWNSRERIDSTEDIKHFLYKCRKMKILPETPSFSYLSQLCAQRGDKANIMIIKDISKELDSEEYKKQACYDLYLAEAVWRNGHFENAMNLFWNVYSENVTLRINIRSTLKVLMADAISKKGEAVLVLITDFSKRFIDIYSDYTFLSYVWEHCFLSEWHSDNEIASRLLELYPELKNTVQLRVHHITRVSLISHKVDVMQRLFEVLLKYEMKTQYELVLRSLFDYACSVRDLYACSAIVQSCYDLDVTLTEVQNARFLNLFCQQDVPPGIKLPIKTWTTETTKFTFKF